MAIAHAASGQVIDVHPPAASQPGEARSVALFKSDQLEVMRLAMPAGKTMPSHWVNGEVTIHCLEGEVDLISGGRTQRMKAGQLVWLQAALDHALTAVQQALVLVTIVLRKTETKDGASASTGGTGGD